MTKRGRPAAVVLGVEDLRASRRLWSCCLTHGPCGASASRRRTSRQARSTSSRRSRRCPSCAGSDGCPVLHLLDGDLTVRPASATREDRYSRRRVHLRVRLRTTRNGSAARCTSSLSSITPPVEASTESCTASNTKITPSSSSTCGRLSQIVRQGSHRDAPSDGGGVSQSALRSRPMTGGFCGRCCQADVHPKPAATKPHQPGQSTRRRPCSRPLPAWSGTGRMRRWSPLQVLGAGGGHARAHGGAEGEVQALRVGDREGWPVASRRRSSGPIPR